MTIRRLRFSILALGGLVLFLATLPALVRLAADWYWFESLGFQRVFLTAMGTKLGLALSIGIAALVFFLANFRMAQRGLVPEPMLLRLGAGRRRIEFHGTLRRLTLPAAVLLAVLFAVAASDSWLIVLKFAHRTSFGANDPVFGRDVGYYVFVLPFLSRALGLVTAALLVALLGVAALYLLRGDIVVWRSRVTVEPSAERHLAALVAGLFATAVVKVYLVSLPSLTYSTTGPLVGASFADLAVKVPAMRLAGGAALVACALAIAGAWRRRLFLYSGAGLGLYVGVWLAGTVIAAAVQRLVVLPNELAKEARQLEYHIAATRAAWGLDEVVVRDLAGEATLTARDIRANAGTIRNVRLWDRDPLLQTFGQLQAIRTYYDFVSVDDDRYWIDGEYRQVLLSPRELNSAALPTRTFINEHLTFTHGMGLTLSPVNQVTEEGLPVLFIKDLPPVSTVSLKITRPEIYYGELSNDYVFVNTRQPEFDYPAGDENAFTRYAGSGGVPVSSFLRRLVLSARFGSLKILLSQDITAESRALYHRRIDERAAKALPFLKWDADPYLVITDEGRLKWILDAYTTSDRYPYSQPVADGTNYMRNSVKVVIDAYDGDVRAFVADERDPLIRTYRKIFPGIFLPLDSMAPDLRAHIRYPNDLFRLQTILYTTFHMRDPASFYHREDQWQIPVVSRTGSTADPFLRHIVMRLPGERQEEYILMAPFTPRQKDNLAAWMVARNDGEHYGQLVVYRFPRQSLVYGPTQVVNRINQDTEIARQISLWDQRGSQVIRGNLLVIPIEESLIYVQALYLRAEGGRIPELKRVIVSHQNTVVMEETLDAALERLFETGSPRFAPQLAASAGGPAEGLDGIEDLIRMAAEHYDRAIAAQRAGNWALYGEEMQRVGEILAQLRRRATSSPRQQ
ncbi:MAG: UPF0182 protein [Gemmatimonadales bacterium]|nr:MAG: UPF0182 protein [Gemmatimonadales bacterium]